MYFVFHREGGMRQCDLNLGLFSLKEEHLDAIQYTRAVTPLPLPMRLLVMTTVPEF